MARAAAPLPLALLALIALFGCSPAEPLPPPAPIVRFESAHVRPIALSPSGERLAAVNTEDARIELFDVSKRGRLSHEGAVRVGLEPVSAVFRDEDELWVVNALSDSISIVDVARGAVTRTLQTGDEPSDVVFAAGRAWVAVRQLDRLELFALDDLDRAPRTLRLAGRMPHRLAASSDGTKLWAIALRGGSWTTTLGVDTLFPGTAARDGHRYRCPLSLLSGSGASSARKLSRSSASSRVDFNRGLVLLADSGSS